MNSKPYFQAYPKDYIADTLDLELEDHGLYWLALCHLWINNGWISKEKFRKILKISPKKFEKKFKKISKFFQFNGENFSQKRLLSELEKYLNVCNRNKLNAKSGADKRWKTESESLDSRIAQNALNQKPETRNQKDIYKTVSKKPKRVKRFTPPTVKSVEEYVKLKGYHFNALEFWGHYDAAEWTRGRNRTPILKWKSCCITWEANALKNGTGNGPPSSGKNIETIDQTDRRVLELRANYKKQEADAATPDDVRQLLNQKRTG